MERWCPTQQMLGVFLGDGSEETAFSWSYCTTDDLCAGKGMDRRITRMEYSIELCSILQSCSDAGRRSTMATHVGHEARWSPGLVCRDADKRRSVHRSIC